MVLLAACAPQAPSAAPAAAWVIDDPALASADPGITAVVQQLPPVDGGAASRVALIRGTPDYAELIAVSTEPGWAGEGYGIIVWRDASGWHVAGRADTAAFCAALAKRPDGAMSPTELAYFGECR
jgi:hypothetical protein